MIKKKIKPKEEGNYDLLKLLISSDYNEFMSFFKIYMKIFKRKKESIWNEKHNRRTFINKLQEVTGILFDKKQTKYYEYLFDSFKKGKPVFSKKETICKKLNIRRQNIYTYKSVLLQNNLIIEVGWNRLNAFNNRIILPWFPKLNQKTINKIKKVFPITKNKSCVSIKSISGKEVYLDVKSLEKLFPEVYNLFYCPLTENPTIKKHIKNAKTEEKILVSKRNVLDPRMDPRMDPRIRFFGPTETSRWVCKYLYSL